MGIEMAQARKHWDELSPWQRKAVVAGAAVELSLKVAALVDIGRRPAGAIRGPKWLWRSAMVVNGIGPVSYWTFGRRRQAAA